MHMSMLYALWVYILILTLSNVLVYLPARCSTLDFGAINGKLYVVHKIGRKYLNIAHCMRFVVLFFQCYYPRFWYALVSHQFACVVITLYICLYIIRDSATYTIGTTTFINHTQYSRISDSQIL